MIGQIKNLIIARNDLDMIFFNFNLIARCIYKDLKFEGGDLKVIEHIHDYRLCKEKCESYKDCFFFTSSHFGCFLKSQEVEIQKRVGFVSGASDAACGG